LSPVAWIAVLATAGAAILTPAYIAASLLVTGSKPEAGTLAGAYAVGILVFMPFPLLVTLFVLPGVAWLALLGLAVPAAVAERLGVRASLARGFALGRVDFAHALGSLAALILSYVLTRLMLILLLRGTGDQAVAVATFLADLVLSPLLFVGAAMLYLDQAARLAVVHSHPTRKPSKRSA
jgi:hypothetical protein